jgi:peptidoglycan/LPS O-acetylase OafA/YrhL
VAWLGTYVVLMIVGSRFNLEARSGLAALILLQRGLLAVTVVSCAYTWRDASARCLRSNDLSYGVYLYHMLVVNVLVHLGLTGHIADLFGTLGVTIVLASLSWKLVEAPALRQKRHALRYIPGYEPVGGESSLEVEGRQRIGMVYP